MIGEGLGKAVLKLTTDDTELDKGLQAAYNKSVQVGKKFQQVGMYVSAVGLGFVALAKNTINTADNFGKMSHRVGVSVESLTGLKHAVELSGSSLEALEKGLGRASRNILDANQGLAESQRTFDALGISITDASGNLRATDEVLMEVADKFAGMKDGTEKTALAMELFGRSGAELIPMLNEGSGGIKEMTNEAAALGLVMSTEAAEASEAFNDSLTRLKGAFQGVMQSIVESGLLDSVTSFVNKIAEMVGNFATGHPTLMKIVAVMGGLAAVVGPLLIAFGAMLPAITALTPAFAALWTAVTGPIGIVVGAIVAVGTALTVLYHKNEGFRKAVQAIWAKIKSMFTTVVKAIVGWLEKLPFVGDKIKKKFDELQKKTEDVGDEMADTTESVEELAGGMEDAANVVDDEVVPAVSDLSEEMQGLYDALADVVSEHDKWAERVSDRAALNLYKEDIVSATVAIIEAGGALSDAQIELADTSMKLIIHQQRVKDSKDAYDDFHDSIDAVNLDLTTLKNKVDDDPLKGVKLTTPGGIALMDSLDKSVDNVSGAFSGLEKNVTKEGGITDKLNKSVSTVFTNMAQGLVDNLFEWEGWKNTLIGTIEELGKALLASVIETFLTPLMEKASEFLTGMIGGLLEGLGESVGGWLGGLFSGDGKGIMPIGPGLTDITTGTGKVGGKITKAIEAIGGGIATGLAAVGGAISTAMGAIWTGLAAAGPAGWIAAIGTGAFFGLKSLIGAISGPSSYEAMVDEIARDFGGVNVPEEVVKAYLDAAGITEPEAWDVRKNITTAPSFLLGVVAKYAEEQGKLTAFMNSLASVQTAWGTFDFQKAFELGLEEGDWAALNEMWLNTSEIGKGAIADVADNFNDLLIPVMEDAEEGIDEMSEHTKDAVDSMHEQFSHFDSQLLETDDIMQRLAISTAELNQQLMALDAQMQSMAGSYAADASAEHDRGIHVHGDFYTIDDFDRTVNEAQARAGYIGLTPTNRA